MKLFTSARHANWEYLKPEAPPNLYELFLSIKNLTRQRGHQPTPWEMISYYLNMNFNQPISQLFFQLSPSLLS